MKPRFEENSYEVTQMLEKAYMFNTRLNILEKAKCDCGKTPCECKKAKNVTVVKHLVNALKKQSVTVVKHHVNVKTVLSVVLR